MNEIEGPWDEWAGSRIRAKKPGMIEIRTARTVEEIQQASRDGNRISIVTLRKNKRLYSELLIVRDRVTGQASVKYPNHRLPTLDHIDQTVKYYPYVHQLPIAAYVIPHDVAPMTIVWVKDVIEDLVGSYGPAGASRLDSCAGVWTGESIRLLFDEKRDASIYVG